MAGAATYSIKTLNDNWYEDRYAPPGSLTGIGDLAKKETRKYESDIAYVGERYDVLARVARVPPKEAFAVPDDGFREYTRTATVDYAHPKTRKDSIVAIAPPKPEFITAETIAEVGHEQRRPVPGNATGFGAVMNRHDPTEGQRFFSTTNGEAYGNRPLRAARSCPSLLPPCGVSTAHEENRAYGMKVGIMCGEEFRESGHPGSDTRVQRSWVHDAAIHNIQHGGTKTKVKGRPDNCLSVPIGDGAMSKIRADLEERKGKLFRVATNVTKGRDQKYGVSIFKDDASHMTGHYDSTGSLPLSASFHPKHPRVQFKAFDQSFHPPRIPHMIGSELEDASGQLRDQRRMVSQVGMLGR